MTPFKVTGMRFHGVPPIPLMNSYLELNVRTYVTYNGVPGIYFFSLDANHLPFVLGARTVFALPYKLARMNYENKNGIVSFSSRRTPSAKRLAVFKASYERQGELFWLLERYCLFTTRGEKVYRGDIHHDKWRVTPAEVNIEKNTMASFSPDTYFAEKPLLHFSPYRRVFIFLSAKKSLLITHLSLPLYISL